MRFDFILITTFLFASAVLADRSREHRSSQFLDVVEKRTRATSDSVEGAANNVAGAVLYASTPIFHNITGTIAVPYIWGKVGSGVRILVGFDDGPDSRCGIMFSAGLIGTVNKDMPSYTAVANWFPGYSHEFTDFEIAYGNLVKVTVGVSNQTAGYATVENINKGIVKTVQVNAIYPICQQSAAWTVEKMYGRDLAHFGIVPIDQPVAYGQDNEEFTATSGASIYNITTEDGLPLTNVRAYLDLDLDLNLLDVVENYV